jgi:predicted permease
MPSSFRSDTRHAIRALARTPAVTAAAILCLGLGLGATTAIYSAVNTALLRPLPFPDPERLATVYRTAPQANTWPFSPANYLDLKAGTTSFEALAAVTPRVALLEGDPEPRRVSVARAADNLFEMLGIEAQRGRLFQTGDDDLAKVPVALISAELWRDRFGSNPDVVGTTVRLDGEATQVIGVLPDGFRLPHGGGQLRSDFWVNLRFSPEQAAVRGANFLMLMGRLRPGTGVAAAHAEMRGLMDGIIEEHPDLRGEQLRVVPMHEENVRAVRGPLLLLLGAVAFVLLISAANVASLLLARGVARRPEFAVRAVLGARRADVLRPALLESGVLAAAGVALGLLLAWLGVTVIAKLLPSQLSQLSGLSIDPAVLAVSLLIALVVAVVCAIAPAWQAATSDPHESLRAGGRGGTGGRHHKWMRGLLVAEVGLSLVLLLGAGLVLRGFEQLVGQDPGFDPEPLLSLTVDIAPDRYEGGSTYDLFLEPALEAVRAVPGVVEAGSIHLVPFDNWGWNGNVHYEGRPADDRTRMPLVENRYVSPSVSGVLGQRLLTGRLLNENDGAGAPFNVVVNEALAKRDFPGEDALGKRFHWSDTAFGTIVGIVSDIRNVGPERPPAPELYAHYEQWSSGNTNFPILVKVAGDPVRVARAVTTAIHSVDPGAAVSRVRPLTEVIAASVGRPRFYLTLLGIFAGVALLLAVAGLYGVMSYAVEQRTREIGIRSALGSTRGGLLVLVLRQGLLLTAGGVGVGLLGALALTRLLGGLLYGVSPLDATTWILVTLALLAVAAAAVLVPARRAASVDPLVAIRIE